MKAKVIRVSEPKRIEIVEQEIPDALQDGEVLVRMKSGGICGSDMHLYHGSLPFATYPRIIGHELAGEIAGAGKGVGSVTAGDHVVIDPVVSCGTCYACRAGRYNVCRSVKVRGVHLDGGFAEYFRVPERSVHRISADIPWPHAALVEPFSVAAQVLSRGGITGEDTVLIYGAGPIGLAILEAAGARGARCIVSDILDSRLDRARTLGAVRVVNSTRESTEEVIGTETGGEGIPVVIEAVGLPALFEEAVRVASPAGRVITLGFDTRPSRIPMVEITRKELDVRGSRLYAHRFPEVVEWFESGTVDPAPLITHEFAFEDIGAALRMIEEHPEQTCKVVLRFD